ncbi:hypothetical protein [Paenarthrobacter aromaticivorans]|uniref:DUF4190 domain-containing protein n=1 Tax=Paenarthrobacter aromaticivorans TaxID=2849150 RepID=A0ABS6IA39_9MICC|nr:hypothetical protein [Paenarthrobacter sp. MMS21-TAE1-1]MBU8868217.1 hypothetical protein [Paenarthrobacter sp. MMS21-TAE1-1]
MASLVIGLASLVLGWTVLFPLVGLVLGFLGITSARTAKGMPIAGLILNAVALLGWVLLVLIVVQPWDFSVPPQK